MLIAAYLVTLRRPARAVGRLGMGSAMVMAGYLVGAVVLSQLG